MVEKILIITANYPSNVNPTNGTFVRELVRAMARKKKTCLVIRPVSLFSKKPKFVDYDKDFYSQITIYSPQYISFSKINLLGFQSMRITQLFFSSAIMRSLRKLESNPDLIYAHFIYPSGAAASTLSKKFRIPSFIGVGESVNEEQDTIWSIRPFGINKAREDLKYLSGLIVNSNLLEKKIENLFPKFANQIINLPNGVDLKKFHPMDKLECRRHLGLPFDKFIVTFVGGFSHRKGVLRVQKAIDGMSNDKIGVIYIGSGEIQPEGKSMLFIGEVFHSELPIWLSASDIFILPTLGEGSCNAILEAMACGLPIITSVGKFNDDIVDETNSIRVDPVNVDEIRKAIMLLKHNNDLREKLSQGSLQKVQNFDIDMRAEKILNWMQKVIST